MVDVTFCAWCERPFTDRVEADKHATNCPMKQTQIEKMKNGQL